MASTRDSSQPGRRLVMLDLLRGVAALAVMFYHFYLGNGLRGPLSGWMPGVADVGLSYGYLGLELFFVLSGFVIALSLMRYPLNAGSVWNFIVRRQLRLDPPYWVSLFLVLLLIFVSSRIIPSHANLAFPSVGEFLLNMFYLQGFAGYEPFLIVGWTLCLEVQFYLVFILALWLFSRLKWGYGMQTFALFPLFLWACAVHYEWLPEPRIFSSVDNVLFISYWALFHLGVLACWAVEKKHLQPAFWGHLVLFALPAFSQPTVESWVVVVIAAGIVLAGSKGWLTRGASCWPLMFLGAISYSLYLMHIPIGGRIINLGMRVSNTPLACVAWFVLATIGSIVMAWLLHRFVEKPAMELSHRLKRRRPEAPAVPATATAEEVAATPVASLPAVGSTTE